MDCSATNRTIREQFRGSNDRPRLLKVKRVAAWVIAGASESECLIIVED